MLGVLLSKLVDKKFACNIKVNIIADVWFVVWLFGGRGGQLVLKECYEI